MLGQIVPATAEHVTSIASRMRAEDAAELYASVGLSPLVGLRLSFERSLYAWTWLVDGVPATMFGVGAFSIIGDVGIVWMMGTDLVVDHWPAFLRCTKRNIGKLLSIYPILTNFVDARYTDCIAWLRWLGFVIEPAVPHGFERRPFHRFTLRA